MKIELILFLNIKKQSNSKATYFILNSISNILHQDFLKSVSDNLLIHVPVKTHNYLLTPFIFLSYLCYCSSLSGLKNTVYY